MVDDEVATNAIEGSQPTDERDASTAVEGARPPGKRAPTLSGRKGERYRLGSEIGRGGMGEILGATDEQIGREVAVKRMKEAHPSERSMSRFFREACIQGRLDHPSIVPVHELGVDDDGRPFFAMKKLTGVTLADLIDQDHPRQRLLRAFADVCLAIEFAHSRGVVHRDLKPQNIVLGDFGEVYILDWGVAKVLADVDDAPVIAKAESAGELTVDGTIIGTRGYMAPEQRRAKDIDGRADVYSLGCVLFEILAGQVLHPKGAGGLRMAKEVRPSVRAPNRDVPPELDELCVCAVADDREARIQTPRELGERVQRFLDGDRDLALRQELARAHLDVARTAFAAGDGEQERRVAMREAGRALALDPKLAGAGELVTRLMLEPPRVRPAEVQRSIDIDNVETLKRVSRNGALGYLGFLCFLPLIFAGGTEHLGYAAAVLVIIAINVGMLLTNRGYNNVPLRAVRICLGNAALIALLARIGSPFLIAPAVATLATMGLVFSPTYTRARAAMLLAATMSLAVLVPWFVEAVGWASPTLSFTEGGIAMDSVLLGISAPAKAAFLVLYVIGVISAAGGLGYANRRAERTVRDRLHLQAWQLRQLVS